ncbi:hypothetical protein KJ764_02030 [Patescibacteria group bacterium]|nr:hypothetical protein [Patescibacteria group bacterium]
MTDQNKKNGLLMFVLGLLAGALIVSLTMSLMWQNPALDNNLSDNFIKKLQILNESKDMENKIFIPGYKANTGEEVIIVTDNVAGANSIIYTGAAYGGANDIIYTGAAYGN